MSIDLHNWEGSLRQGVALESTSIKLPELEAVIVVFVLVMLTLPWMVTLLPLEVEKDPLPLSTIVLVSVVMLLAER